MSSTVYFTRAGHEKLVKELTYLKTVRRREISKQIGEARAHGDISENAEYDAAKEAQGMLEKRIYEMESRLGRARIIEEENIPDDKVYIGAIVKLKDLNRERTLCYTLVSEEEADYAQGKISTAAPVGRALLGKEEGDVVNIKVPAGTLSYEILEISR